ncbi:1811_t:CDS:2, partial [Dentiscutata erythropus]
MSPIVDKGFLNPRSFCAVRRYSVCFKFGNPVTYDSNIFLVTTACPKVIVIDIATLSFFIKFVNCSLLQENTLLTKVFT